MLNRVGDVRHVVAWLPFVRWVTCGALWIVGAAAWLFPHFNLSLRSIAPFGLTAAICRTTMTLLARRGRSAPRALFGICWLC